MFRCFLLAYQYIISSMNLWVCISKYDYIQDRWLYYFSVPEQSSGKSISRNIGQPEITYAAHNTRVRHEVMSVEPNT